VHFEKESNENSGLKIFYTPTKNPPAIADPPTLSNSNFPDFSSSLSTDIPDPILVKSNGVSKHVFSLFFC
jgi:hypothetical protein